LLEGYATCSGSTVNGYGAWSDLNTYWYGALSSSDLTGLTCLDFEATDFSGGNYLENTEKATSVSLQQKWTMMQAMYEANLSSGQVDSLGLPNVTMPMLWLLALLGLSTSAIFVFFRKRQLR
jgi:hypothetical protein